MRKKTFIYILIPLIFFACSSKFIVSKRFIIFREEGIVLFANDSGMRKIMTGDIQTGYSMPGIFIKQRFQNQSTSKEQIISSLFDKREKKVHFIELYNNCDDTEKKQVISESTSIMLEKDIDSFLVSKKIYLYPVTIAYHRIGSEPAGYKLYKKSIALKYHGDSTLLQFDNGYYYVLGFDYNVSYDWPTPSKGNVSN